MAPRDPIHAFGGLLGPGGVMLATVAGVVTALVLGPVYGIATYYIPYVYLNFLLTI